MKQLYGVRGADFRFNFEAMEVARVRTDGF